MDDSEARREAVTVDPGRTAQPASGPQLDAEPGLWAQLFAQHPSVMLLVDPTDGRIVAANTAAERFYGWSEAELRARRINDVNTLTEEEARHEMAAAAAAERGYFAFRHRRADGTVRDVEVYSGPVELEGRTLLYSVVHDASERARATAALQASEDFARTIVAHAPLGVVVSDLTGRIREVNPAMGAIGGWSEAELLGRDELDLSHPEDRPSVAAARAQLWAAQLDRTQLSNRLRRRDGTVADVETVTTLLHDGEGRAHSTLSVVLDVSELRASEARSARAATEARAAADRAQQAVTQLTATMEAVTDGILLLSDAGLVTYANPRVAALLDRAPDGIRGRTPAALFPTAPAAELTAACHAARAADAPRTVTLHHPGVGRWLEVHVYPAATGLALYLRDISDRVAREAALARIAAAEREDAARLRQLDEAKNAFLSAVSHELRTPLTVVRGMAETLVGRREQLTDADRVRLESALLDQAGKLAARLDGLLQVDRLSRGALTARRTTIDVAGLVRQVVADSPVADQVELHAPARLDAEVDRVQVEHLLANLLTNAGKYAPGTPVSVRLAGEPDGGVRIEVRDHGPGVPAAWHDRIFEPFVRADDDHPAPGTGVGLALVAEFARLHGGRVHVEDAAPGARFVVTLPPPGDAAPGPAGAPASASPPDDGPRAPSSLEPDPPG